MSISKYPNIEKLARVLDWALGEILSLAVFAFLFLLFVLFFAWLGS